MRRILGKFILFIKIDHTVRWLMIRGFVLSGIVRLLILTIPFRKFSKYLGEHNRESPEEVTKEEYKLAHQISSIVACISKYTPWESKCLVQAIVAQYLLKKRHIGSTLYLGVAKSEAGDMRAHAWLRTGRMIVTGGDVAPYFKEVSRFANDLYV